MMAICRTVLLLAWLAVESVAFTPSSRGSSLRRTLPLFVSIGLGPEQQDKEAAAAEAEPEFEYEIPNHEEYRTSRRSKLDEQVDAWFGQLMSSGPDGCLGDLAAAARTRLTTPVPLENEVELPRDDPEWTPYVSTKLPWTPLTPAFGLEEFGLPTPRRNAEAWRHFDVPGLVGQDYSGISSRAETATTLSEERVQDLTRQLQTAGAWLPDDQCQARLVYINGHFCEPLSKTTPNVYNLQQNPTNNTGDEDIAQYLQRLPDGYTDELAAPVPVGDDEYLTSFQKLSGPDHSVGKATCQFAINTQQGTACFAALNTLKTQHVAVVRAAAGSSDNELPVLLIQAQTPSGGGGDDDTGIAVHPRTVVVAKARSRLSVVQSSVDLDADREKARPRLVNGYTQIFCHEASNVTHSYLEETGGIVTGGTELPDEEFLQAGQPIARELESRRPQLRNTHMEAIDVHITGEDGAYKGTIMSIGGSGRVRIAHSVALLKPGAHAAVNGFSLTGGAQRTDMKTNLHHIAAGTTSRQVQKNMIGGRAVGAFRGRVRVEQSAQQTDSSQLCRTVLLSDRARAWAVPSLEIVADDVQCAHGATVSDLSQEELFYLQSRGLDVSMARNLLMYAFAGDISSSVEPRMLGSSVDSQDGLQQRVIRRLENLVPQGVRAVKGEYQSI